jgi:multicomponent Na+:H+ antiporter subunit G
MEAFLSVSSWGFLMAGGFLGISGAVGLLRFPDFFTRLHAVGVTDTLCASFIVLGLMLQSGWSLTLVKLLLILLILFITSPTSTHALAKAARHGHLEPLVYDQEGVPPSKS